MCKRREGGIMKQVAWGWGGGGGSVGVCGYCGVECKGVWGVIVMPQTTIFYFWHRESL